MKTAEHKAFKPFLVEGGGNGKNIFRIVEMTRGVTRKQIEKLFEKLPISFDLRKECLMGSESLNEPLEVFVAGPIIYIYPPRHRVIVCTSFNSWRFTDVVTKMHVDNMMDMTTSGRGQIRSCVHFDPAILNIKDWPETAHDSEIEIDMFVHPKEKRSEPEFKAPSFSKWDVRRLLELIAGGEKRLTVKQLRKWRDLIMYAVRSMRSCYENPDVAEDYPVRVYYKPYWEEIEAAKDDSQLVGALEGIRSAIKWE